MKRFLIGTAATLSLLAAVTGCSSTKKIQPAALQTFTPSLSASVAWKLDVGRTPRFESGVGQFAPAVGDDVVFAASTDGSVTKASLSDGKLLWKTNIGSKISAGVASGSGVSSNMALVVSEANELVVINSDGKVLRKIATGGVAQEIPALLGNIAVVRLSDNRVAGFDIQTGTRRWVLQRNLPPLVLHAQSGLRVAARPSEEATSSALGSGDLLVNMPGGRLMWLDATTGAVRWEVQVATPRGTNEVERIVDMLGAPIAQAADVCSSAYQTLVACFAGESGRRIWSRELVVSTTVSADERFVFAADDQSRLFALSRKTGEVSWSTEAFRMRGLMHPTSRGRAVWVADRFGFLHALSREDGKLLARISMDGGAPSGAIRLTARGLVIQSQGGQLMLVRSEG